MSKGYGSTLSEAKRLGCEAVQIFLKNPRTWAPRKMGPEEVEEFRLLAAAVPVCGHLSYLPNLGKKDGDRRNLEGLLHEASLCDQLGIGALVVHCGSNEDREQGIVSVRQCVREVLTRTRVSVLLENASGQKHALGKDFSELGRICDGVGDAKRVGLCIDTAHIFEAGYDIRMPGTWETINAEAARHCGANAIRFFHLNDSKTPWGSGVDRHWHIGQGEIGSGGFRLLLREKRFAHLAGVMETPKMGGMDEKNMEVMRSLLPPLVPGPSP